MYRVAWWISALLALGSARVYDRCELARDLEAYGVPREHISTWVCIAEHESQYDTAAQNYGSGDHGIFQISELYWCGPGKACGVPCTAFRDDDIRDDIQCSMIIHKEHTRLQGDGFLAWVVYAQHCKHNTKKYLAGCDGAPKTFTTKTNYKTFANDYFEKNATTYRTFNPPNIRQNYRPNVQQNPPQGLSYLAVSQLFQDSFNNFEESYTGGGVQNWADFKLDNIDELTLPQFNTRQNTIPSPPQTTTTTTTTYAPPVKPWRVIETNQFRNRISNNDKDSARYDIGKYDDTPRYDKFDAKYSVSNNEYYTKTSLAPTVVYSAPILTTTYKPEVTSSVIYTSPTSSYRFPAVSNTYSVPTTQPPRVTQGRLPSYQVYQSQSIRQPSFSQRISTARPFTTRQPWYDNQFYQSEPVTRVTSHPTFATRSWTTAPTTRRPYTSTSTYRYPSTTYRSSFGSFRSPGARPTQSIFELYLNPTKRPPIPSFSFGSSNNSPYRLKIFSDGTTTPPPSYRWPFGG